MGPPLATPLKRGTQLIFKILEVYLCYMKINVDKCAVLHCIRSLTPIQYAYQLLGHFLDVKKLHTYLGIGIDNTMSWSSHVQTISNRSTKVLNFIKRNLYNCPPT